MFENFDFHTKKYIATTIVTAFIGVSIYQVVVMKESPVALAGMAGVIVEKYFNGSKPDKDVE